MCPVLGPLMIRNKKRLMKCAARGQRVSSNPLSLRRTLKESRNHGMLTEITYEDSKIRTVTFDATQFVDITSINM